MTVFTTAHVFCGIEMPNSKTKAAQVYANLHMPYCTVLEAAIEMFVIA
jgi:hypothetical protein